MRRRTDPPPQSFTSGPSVQRKLLRSDLFVVFWLVDLLEQCPPAVIIGSIQREFDEPRTQELVQGLDAGRGQG